MTSDLAQVAGQVGVSSDPASKKIVPGERVIVLHELPAIAQITLICAQLWAKGEGRWRLKLEGFTAPAADINLHCPQVVAYADLTSARSFLATVRQQHRKGALSDQQHRFYVESVQGLRRPFGVPHPVIGISRIKRGGHVYTHGQFATLLPPMDDAPLGYAPILTVYVNEQSLTLKQFRDARPTKQNPGASDFQGYWHRDGIDAYRKARLPRKDARP